MLHLSPECWKTILADFLFCLNQFTGFDFSLVLSFFLGVLGILGVLGFLLAGKCNLANRGRGDLVSLSNPRTQTYPAKHILPI